MSSTRALEFDAVTLNSVQDQDALDGRTRALINRRVGVLGPGYSLQYARPINPVRASGTQIWDASGEILLDAYNNVPCVGHANPRVVEAMSEQLSMVSTNTRYLQDKVIEYAEDLLSTFHPVLNRVMFTCTGSEANDLAVRVAREVTGQTGIVASNYAYHGNTDLVSSFSPSGGARVTIGRDVRLVPAPDVHRNPGIDAGSWLAARVQDQIEDLHRRGVGLAAFIVDGLFSSDGIHPLPKGALQQVADVVHRAGGLFILDEVQSGFCRTGENFWGYETFGVVPDLITLGKPMANGLPVAALVARRDYIDDFGTRMSYFNTFAGNTGCIAAAHAVLKILRAEQVLGNVAKQGGRLRDGILASVRGAHHDIDVRGRGMYIGVEISEPDEDKTPDPAAAAAVVDALREDGVLISLAGPAGNVLKIRPPLVFSDSDADRFLTSFERTVRSLAV